MTCSLMTADTVPCGLKKLEGEPDVWSVRVSLNLRAVAKREGDTVTWFWIGPHKEFDRLFS